MHRWLPVLALIVAPCVANAQSAQTPPSDPAANTTPAPAVSPGVTTLAGTTATPGSTTGVGASTTALPPPPPGAGPDGAPPPGMLPPPGYPTATSSMQSAPTPPPAYPPSYGYPPYYGAGYGPMPHRRVVEYHGGRIPPGATLETQRSGLLLVGGAVTFAALYLTSVLSAVNGSGMISCASSSCGGDWLYAPIIGPFVAMGIGSHSGSDTAYLLLDGILQSGGVAMFLVGLFNTRQVLVFIDYANTAHPRTAQWTLTPGAPGAPLGATLSVVRF